MQTLERTDRRMLDACHPPPFPPETSWGRRGWGWNGGRLLGSGRAWGPEGVWFRLGEVRSRVWHSSQLAPRRTGARGGARRGRRK